MGWTTSKIGEYCLVGDGAHAKIPRRESGVMYLTSKNFKPSGLDLSKIDFISAEDFDKHFRQGSKAVTKPETSDVLVSIIGSLGEPYVVRSSDRFGLSSSVAIIRPQQDTLAPEYLYYWIKASPFQSAVYGTKGGVAQSYLSLEMIRSLPLCFPSLRAQRKIAGVLSAYDDLIENNTRRINILGEMAQLIYREWFVNFRFPSHEKVRMIEPEDGTAIPDGWRLESLGSTSFNFDSKRKPLSSIERQNRKGLYPYYGAAKVFDYIDDYIFDGRYLLFAEDGSVITSDRKPVLQLTDGKFWPNNHTHILQGKSPVSTNFLYLSVKGLDISGYVTGAAQPKITQANLNRLPVIVPTQTLLTDFDAISTPMLEQVTILNRKNDNLRRTRDLLLPKLISGEVSVEHLEAEAVAQGI